MPKAKTSKAVAKRVRITATGKLMRNRQGKSHLLSTKSPKRKRMLRTKAEIWSKPFAKKIRPLIAQ